MVVAVQLSVLGLYLPASVQYRPPYQSTPDDHFTAGPHRGVTARAAGALAVLVAVQLSVIGIVSPAGVQKRRRQVYSTPDDHLGAGPDCRVTAAAIGRISGAGGSPTCPVLGSYLPPVFSAS